MKVNHILFRLIFVIVLLTIIKPDCRAQSETGNVADTAGYTFIKTPVTKLFIPGNDTIQLLVQGIKQGQARILSFIIQNVVSGVFSIERGKMVSIYIEDGTTLKLMCQKNVYSTFGGMTFGNYISVDYPLSVYDLDFFKTYATGNIEIEYSGGVFSFDIGAAESEELKKVIGMIR